MHFALVALLFATVQQLPQTAVIEGVVTRTGSTSSPIAAASVKATAPSPLKDGSLLVLETTTDGAGHFIFPEVPPGTFKLEISHERYGFLASKYVFLPTQAIQVTVTPGQRLRVPRLALTPSATIRGRVLDSEGQGIAGVPVEFLRMTQNERGQRVWAPSPVETETNDKGEYEHEMLGPGDYYVRTIIDARSDLPTAVYHPATSDGSAAAPVPLVEGSQVVADIRVGSVRNAPTYRVSGKVEQPFAATVPVQLILMKRDPREPCLT